MVARVHVECTIVCVCLQRLEQIIVVALKKKGMQRDHICFRKCYNRLFTLSKSFLKVHKLTYMHCVCTYVCRGLPLSNVYTIIILCTVCSKQYCHHHLLSILVIYTFM